MIDAMTEKEIMARALADPDAQPTTKADWKHAYQPNLPGKESITIRLDRGVLSWFRAKGGRYQTQINDALREYMDDHIQGRRPAETQTRRAAEARAGFRGKARRR